MADLDAAIEAAARAYDAELNGRLGNPPGSVLGDVHDPGLARISAFRAAIAGAAPLIRADERAKVRAELLIAAEEWLNQANDLQRRNLVPDLQRHYADAAEQLADVIVHPGRIAPEPTPKEQR